MQAPMKTAKELGHALGVAIAHDAQLARVGSISQASHEVVVFAQDKSTLQEALASPAGLILAWKDAPTEDPRVVKVRDPKYAFAVCARELAPPDESPLINPAAIIDPTAKIGAGTRVGAGAVVEANAAVGNDCLIGSNATICRGAVLGDRVVVQSGAVLGATGFGYAHDPETGEHLLFPQQGTLIVEDDVEIGANTTIDRGALGETRIGAGTKIDNLVHIAHNCNIGSAC